MKCALLRDVPNVAPSELIDTAERVRNILKLIMNLSVLQKATEMT